MPIQIYVGGIAPRTTAEEVTAMFSPFGEITSVATGTSGYAYVNMKHRHEGWNAINHYAAHPIVMDDRTLRIIKSSEIGYHAALSKAEVQVLEFGRTPCAPASQSPKEPNHFAQSHWQRNHHDHGGRPAFQQGNFGGFGRKFKQFHFYGGHHAPQPQQQQHRCDCEFCPTKRAGPRYNANAWTPGPHRPHFAHSNPQDQRFNYSRTWANESPRMVVNSATAPIASGGPGFVTRRRFDRGQSRSVSRSPVADSKKRSRSRSPSRSPSRSVSCSPSRSPSPCGKRRRLDSLDDNTDTGA